MQSWKRLFLILSDVYLLSRLFSLLGSCFIFIWSHLPSTASIFFLLLEFYSESPCLCLSVKEFNVYLHLTMSRFISYIISFIHFHLFMFLQSEWYRSSFIPLHVECPVSLFNVQCPQNCLLNWLAFLQCKLRIFADNHWNDHLSLSQQSLLYFIGFMSDFCVSLYISLFFNSRTI